MIKKLNPITWLVRAMDATDRAVERLDTWSQRWEYRGKHWATA